MERAFEIMWNGMMENEDRITGACVREEKRLRETKSYSVHDEVEWAVMRSIFLVDLASMSSINYLFK